MFVSIEMYRVLAPLCGGACRLSPAGRFGGNKQYSRITTTFQDGALPSFSGCKISSQSLYNALPYIVSSPGVTDLLGGTVGSDTVSYKCRKRCLWQLVSCSNGHTMLSNTSLICRVSHVLHIPGCRCPSRPAAVGRCWRRPTVLRGKCTLYPVSRLNMVQHETHPADNMPVLLYMMTYITAYLD